MAEPGFFQEYRLALRRELTDLFELRHPLYQMLRYHMGWSDETGRPATAEGKMVRGLLCLEASRAASGDFRQALPAAAAVEIVHNFSLVHDDIEDTSPLRRQRATVWKLWGQPQAINAGDAMLVLAHLSLLKLPGRGVAPHKFIQAATILDNACLELCQGQHEDLSYESRLDITMSEYMSMISHKTGALFEASMLLGATLATDEERVIRGLGLFGRALGMAFQLQDDELGIWGDELQTGKSTTSDIYEKKKSLPIIYALEESTGEEREELRRIYQQNKLGAQDEASIRQILSNVAAQQFTQGMSEKYFHTAHAELESVGLPPESLKEIEDTVAYMMARRG